MNHHLTRALAIAENLDASPALRALSLQLRDVEKRSLAAKATAEQAQRAHATAVTEGVRCNAEAEALVKAITSIESIEAAARSTRVERLDEVGAALDALTAGDGGDDGGEDNTIDE